MSTPSGMDVYKLISELLAPDYNPERVFFSEFMALDVVGAILTMLSSFTGTDDMLLFFTKMSREVKAIQPKDGDYQARDGDSVSDMCPWSWEVYLTATTVYQSGVVYWPTPEELDADEGIFDIFIPLKEITTSLEEELLRRASARLSNEEALARLEMFREKL